jgi:hypothetical protein
MKIVEEAFKTRKGTVESCQMEHENADISGPKPNESGTPDTEQTDFAEDSAS